MLMLILIQIGAGSSPTDHLVMRSDRPTAVQVNALVNATSSWANIYLPVSVYIDW